MSVIVAAGTATELAIAADSLTWATAYDPPILEHEDQPRVLVLGGRQAIGTFGIEYILDPERFDLERLTSGEPVGDSFDVEREQLRRHERFGRSSIGELAHHWWTGRYAGAGPEDESSPAACHEALAGFLIDRIVLEFQAAAELGAALPEDVWLNLLTLGFEGTEPFAGLATLERHGDEASIETYEIELDQSFGFSAWAGAPDENWAEDLLTNQSDPAAAAINAVGWAIESDRERGVSAPAGGRIRCAAVTAEGARFVPGPDVEIPELPDWDEAVARSRPLMAAEPAPAEEATETILVPEDIEIGSEGVEPGPAPPPGAELCWCGSGKRFDECHGANGR